MTTETGSDPAPDSRVRASYALAVVRELGDAWRRAFEQLVDDFSFEPPHQATDGSAAARCSCSMNSVDGILACLPGDYVPSATRWEEMFDDSGEGVDYESESAVWHCDAERAVVSYVEHWQAGLFATVALYADDDTYRDALTLRLSEVNEERCQP